MNLLKFTSPGGSPIYIEVENVEAVYIEDITIPPENTVLPFVIIKAKGANYPVCGSAEEVVRLLQKATRSFQ